MELIELIFHFLLLSLFCFLSFFLFFPPLFFFFPPLYIYINSPVEIHLLRLCSHVCTSCYIYIYYFLPMSVLRTIYIYILLYLSFYIYIRINIIRIVERICVYIYIRGIPVDECKKKKTFEKCNVWKKWPRTTTRKFFSIGHRSYMYIYRYIHIEKKKIIYIDVHIWIHIYICVSITPYLLPP